MTLGSHPSLGGKMSGMWSRVNLCELSPVQLRIQQGELPDPVEVHS